MTPHTLEQPGIRITGTSSYARHGDTVVLFAERIDNPDSAAAATGPLCLQLWACQSPYAGGDLAGWKVAEAPLGVLQPGQSVAPVNAETFASFPAAGDYAMTLVIAEWDGESYSRIHDFHTYPARDVFIHPRLEGRVGYRFVDDLHLVVEVERICNPRDPDNLSGTLSLELWALPQAYAGGDFEGHALGAMTLGTLSGGASWQDSACELALTPPPPGDYTLVLMLREWTGNGYVTRDHCNFTQPVTFAPAATANGTAEVLTTADATGRPPAVPAEADEPAAPAPQTGGQAPAPRPGKDAMAQTRANRWKRSVHNLWDWIKRHW